MIQGNGLIDVQRVGHQEKVPHLVEGRDPVLKERKRYSFNNQAQESYQHPLTFGGYGDRPHISLLGSTRQYP